MSAGMQMFTIAVAHAGQQKATGEPIGFPKHAPAVVFFRKLKILFKRGKWV